MTTWKFWSDAFERALRTAAQTAVAALSVGKIGLLDVDWKGTLSMSAMSAVLSILTSIAASATVGDATSASLIE